MTTAPDLTAATARLALHHHDLLERLTGQGLPDAWVEEWRGIANPVAIDVSAGLEQAEHQPSAAEPRPIEEPPIPAVEVPDQTRPSSVTPTTPEGAIQLYREVSTALKWLALQPAGVQVPEHIARVVERELRLHVPHGSHLVFVETGRRWSIESIAEETPENTGWMDGAGRPVSAPGSWSPAPMDLPSPAMMPAPADDPKPGLTGNATDDLEALAAWAKRQPSPPDLPAAAPAYRPPTEAQVLQPHPTADLSDVTTWPADARERLATAVFGDPEHGLHRGQLVEQRIRAAFVLYLGPVYTSGLFVTCDEHSAGSIWLSDGPSVVFVAETRPAAPTEHDNRTDRLEVWLAPYWLPAEPGAPAPREAWSPLEEFVREALGTLGLL